MPKFQLFRVTVHPESQPDLFRDGDFSRPEVLKRVLASDPSAASRGDVVWHVGNLEQVEENRYYFRIGKTSNSTIDKYEGGDFRTREIEASPNTHVFLDAQVELAAIAAQYQLANKIAALGRRLSEVLNQSEEAKKIGVSFKVKPISDPREFIEYLVSAYRIVEFKAWFSRPNPFDSNEDFYVPLQTVLEKLEGEGGEATIKGENLNAEKLEDVARSAASTGDPAEAKLQMEADQKPVTRKLNRDEGIIVEWEGIDEEKDRLSFFEYIKGKYNEVREAQDE
jgi:hypothetical protein